VPAHQAWDYIRRNELVMAPLQHVSKERGHYFCYLSRQHLPTRVRVFADFMTEHISHSIWMAWDGSIGTTSPSILSPAIWCTQNWRRLRCADRIGRNCVLRLDP
jgi:hypothetical protein